MHALIPVSNVHHGFTTCSYLASLYGLTLCPLEDESLGVHKVFPKTTHRVVTPPDDTCSAWEAFYPQGSINPKGDIAGGFGFYISGPPSFLGDTCDIKRDVVMSYHVKLQDSWEWALGGKLPGVFGGEGESAYGCTGGRQHQRSTCFNIRPMWRPDGKGELYTYLPLTESNSNALLSVPESCRNGDYGFSVGRGSFTWPTNRWVAVGLRVKTGSADGALELFIDGESVISVEGLNIPGESQGMHFQTFFGGHTPEWASPKDQRAWFKGITGVVLK
ncbi:hypothetical protein BDZ89DRAFT_1103437 [Hymenopellis radicata]|nr:hypothetical protein BDZ89DRAFT_1103437 [Hymenopellis radicata]